MINNEIFGITTQYFICQKFNLENNIDLSRIDKDYFTQLEPVIDNIFSTIKEIPNKFTTFDRVRKYGSNSYPFNFLLSDNKTLSIKTNSTGKHFMQSPPIVGQPGVDTFNYHFGHLSDKPINDSFTFKKLVLNTVDSMLPIYLEYCFISDYTIWIFFDKNSNLSYKIIFRDNLDTYDFDKNLFSFTKNINTWNESNTLKYNNYSIGEFQCHKNRSGFKFRFNFKNLIPLLEEFEFNNESLGMTCEKVICDLFNLEYDISLNTRSLIGLYNRIFTQVKEAFKYLPPAIKHTGSEQGKRGKNSKSEYDFLLTGNKKLSVKTNWGNKVCPPEVGQPGASTFDLYFGHLYEGGIDEYKFKELCINKTQQLMDIYIKHLFDCDFIFWLYYNKKENVFNYKILDSTKLHSIYWKQSLFSFTKNLEEWNESSTLKYNNTTIGEFQVHRKRNSYKFRFNMKNLLIIFNKEFGLNI